jgi:ATP synthase protein I
VNRNRSLLASRNRLAALATSAAGLLAVLVSWAAVGDHGPLSALLGLVMVLAFFSAGTLPFVVAGDGTGGRSGLAFLVLGMTYVLRILAGVVVYQVATRSDAVDSTVVGLTVISCALVWVNTQVVVGLSRRHQPTLDV